MGEKRSFRMLIGSLAWVVYVLFLIMPFTVKYHFVSEYTSPPPDKILLYFLMTVPVFSVYVVFMSMNIKKMGFLKTLNYPLIIFSLFSGFFYCLLILGKTMMFTMLFLTPVFLISIGISFVLGILMDFYDYKKRSIQRLK